MKCSADRVKHQVVTKKGKQENFARMLSQLVATKQVIRTASMDEYIDQLLEELQEPSALWAIIHNILDESVLIAAKMCLLNPLVPRRIVPGLQHKLKSGKQYWHISILCLIRGTSLGSAIDMGTQGGRHREGLPSYCPRRPPPECGHTSMT